MTKVKICGITRAEDARRAVELGAWALGLIFAPHSPRACPPQTAQEIAGELRRRVELAGVFVNATLDEVAAMAEACFLSMVQLHGDEGPAYCAEVARRTGCKVIKAARIRDAASLRALRAFRVDYRLLDTYVPGRRGGTGHSFDWELARGLDRSVPVIVSGGLTADNVAEAIAAVRPFAVDTASGTEAAPGRKDEGKLLAFFHAVAQGGGSEEPPRSQHGAGAVGTAA